MRVNATIGETLESSKIIEITMFNTFEIDLQAIQQHAESNAEKFVFQYENLDNYTYYSSKYSNISTTINNTINTQISNLIKKFPSLKSNKQMYRKMTLNNDTHFYNLMVNTNYSSVHVPINIYDKGKSEIFFYLYLNKILYCIVLVMANLFENCKKLC